MPETNYVSAINVHICRSVVSGRAGGDAPGMSAVYENQANSAVTCNDFLSFERWPNMASESTSADIEGSVFQVLECVVNYVDPTTSSNAMNACW